MELEALDIGFAVEGYFAGGLEASQNFGLEGELRICASVVRLCEGTP